MFQGSSSSAYSGLHTKFGGSKVIPQDLIFIKTRLIVEESIDEYFLWVYFDGSALGDPRTYGAGGLIYFSDEHFVRFKVGIGFGTNNFAKLLGLKL